MNTIVQKTICFLLLLLISMGLQAQFFYPVDGFYGKGENVSTCVANDNLLTGGYSTGTSLKFGFDTLHNYTGMMGYVCNQQGYALRFGGGVGKAKVLKLGTSLEGYWDIVVGTYNTPRVDIGKDTLVNSGDTSNTNDIFISRMRFNGLKWTRYWKSMRLGGEGDDVPTGLSNVDSGRFIIMGYTNSKKFKAGNDSILSPFTTGKRYFPFVVELDTLLHVRWLHVFYDTAQNIHLFNLADDRYGDFIIGGDFRGDSVRLGGVSSPNYDTGKRTGKDIFIADLDKHSGRVNWIKTIGAKGDDTLTALSSDLQGNYYLAGIMPADSINIQGKVLKKDTAKGLFSYLIRIDNLGNANLWKMMPGDKVNCLLAGYDAVIGAYSANRFIYYAGRFKSKAIEMDTFRYRNYDTLGNTYDIYWGCMDSATGNVVYVKHYGGNKNDYPIFIAGAYLDECCLSQLLVCKFESDTLKMSSNPSFKVKRNDSLFNIALINGLSWVDVLSRGELVGLSHPMYGWCETLLAGNFATKHFRDTLMYPFHKGNSIINYGDTSTFNKVVALCPEGIIDVPIPQNVLTLYPNPAQNHLRVQYTGYIQSVEVMDITGKTLLVLPIANAQRADIDITHLSCGMYIVKARAGGRVAVQKFIKTD